MTTPTTDGGPATAARGDQTPMTVELDGRASLPELTALLQQACDLAEDGRSSAALLLRLTNTGAWSEDLGIHQVNRWERAVRRLELLGALTVCTVDGTCGGAALDVFLAADRRIAGSGLRIVLNGRDGLPWPGMTLYRLTHLAGAAQTRRLLFRGDGLGGDEALALGLVDEINDDPARAESVLDELGRAGATELAIRRRLVLEAMTTSYEDAIGPHLAACDRSLRSRGQAGELAL
ncbi:enoyl-CoA-hydratase DpgB [Streptomyces sp. NPDC021093]|uniref:enoyl-CoA-hydratase DpgB n=1 Tax=Streptomyces sp. NPDC021093 TaxID=3365112 RepID=UPI0037A65F2F